MFPKFLLPPSIFRTKKANAGMPSEVPVDENPREKYIQGHISCIRCSNCAAELCLTTQIISKGFTGRHGRAYLVSAQPTVSAPSTPGETLPNTLLQSPVSRHLVTGAHTVSDINCVVCESVLGWKYISAGEQSQKYKVGKFILETSKTIKTPACDTAFETRWAKSTSRHSLKPTAAASSSGFESIEFDSQDEDECEDLFSGVWSPQLAVRRRNRVARHGSTLGVGL